MKDVTNKSETQTCTCKFCLSISEYGVGSLINHIANEAICQALSQWQGLREIFVNSNFPFSLQLSSQRLKF